MKIFLVILIIINFSLGIFIPCSGELFSDKNSEVEICLEHEHEKIENCCNEASEECNSFFCSCCCALKILTEPVFNYSKLDFVKFEYFSIDQSTNRKYLTKFFQPPNLKII